MRLLLILMILVSVGPTGQSWASGIRLLVPAYGNPCCSGGQEMWVQLTDTASTLANDLLVILNPASGPDIDLIDPNYVNDSAEGPFIDFRDAGGVAIGYVGTEWAERSLDEVQAEVDLYFDPAYWRGAGVQIEGIFFDEMSSDLADVGYYLTLRDYVRGLAATAIVFGNPGTSFVNNPSGQSTWSVSDYAESADTLVTFESTAGEYLNNYTPPSWIDSYPAERFGHIVYEMASSNEMLSSMKLAGLRNAGYVYFTDDVLPNPYDVLASYWEAEVVAARSLLFADGFESGDLTAWEP